MPDRLRNSAMRLGITWKLFLAVLVTNVATAIMVGLGVRSAFDSGFERYRAEREQQRLARLVDVFANAYRDAGSWDFLRGSDELWVQLNHAVRPDIRELDGRGPGPRPWPGPGPASGAERPAPEFREAESRPPPPPDGRKPGGPGPRARDGKAGPQFGRPPRGLVLDAQGKVVTGDANPNQELERRPITVDGKQVGWLASPLRQKAFDIVDRRFQEQQWRASWIAGLAALSLAALVAWLLSRGMIAPVKRIATATRRLADGDYRIRVDASSRDEIGQLVEDFNRLGNALEKNETLRRNFMADVSHELRTPIAVLKAEIEALQDGVRPLTLEALASLHSEVARLGQLVKDIHELSLADVGGLAYTFEAVDLEATVGEALAAWRGQLDARGIGTEVHVQPGLPAARGDSTRLEQLVANLVTNSIRYTDEGGRIVVTLRRQDNKVALTWEDSTPGVPEEALPRLFERLFRVDASRNRASGGSGLGLAICKSIVEAHGGKISARASSLGGLALDVELPIAEDRRP